MYRIIYNKVYSTEKEAFSDFNKIKGNATNPKVVKGKAIGTWLIVLYECKTKERLEQGCSYFRAKKLKVYRTEF